MIDYIFAKLGARRIPVTGQGYVVVAHYRAAPQYRGQYKYGRMTQPITVRALNKLINKGTRVH